MEHKDFYLNVAHALSGCQLVEQEIKLYISEALELAKKCIGDRLVFKMNGEDYEDSSLERLIESFKKFCNNEKLIKDLQAFKRERNFLSHKGITHCLDYEGDLYHPVATDFQERLNNIKAEAVRLRAEVREEGNKFRGILYFGKFSEEG